MESQREQVPLKEKSILAKALKVFLWTIASLIFLIILILILIQTSFVQNLARKKIVSYLENKLKTKVKIGILSVKFPTAISLQNVFFEDQSKDTLLYGGELVVDLSMLKLLRKDVDIQEISLNNLVVKIKRLAPDSVFNFQYIADAFAVGAPSASQPKDASSLKINIDRIFVNNTRIVFKDDVTGNDVDLAIGHLDTKISTFDPSHFVFDIPSITLKGLKGHVYQLQPSAQTTLTKAVAPITSGSPNSLQFSNKEMKFSNIDVVYKNEPSKISSSFVIGDLNIHPKKFDLKNSIYTLKDASLNNSAIDIAMLSPSIALSAKDTATGATSAPPFKIISEDLTINKSSLKYDDNSIPHKTDGMDYSHLNFIDLSLKANNLEYNIDTINVSITSASLTEQSGFVLNNLTTDFAMNPSGVSLKNLDIETPGSSIKKSAVITYSSLAAIQKDPGVLGLNLDLQNTKMSMRDLLLFVPQLREQLSSLPAGATLYVDTKISGKVNDLNFKKLQLTGMGATAINASGIIKGLPDLKKLYADLIINTFKTSATDIHSLVPKGTLPATITLPESIAASGKIKGGMKHLATDLSINTSLGSANINGILVDITDQKKVEYNLALHAGNLQLGKLMQNEKLGPLTGDFKVTGRGLEPDIANANFSSTISNVTLNNYAYTNIQADGNIANKVYKINASVHDPNLEAELTAGGEFGGKFPDIQLKATIDSIKTLPLHLTTTSMEYHGDIDGDFTNTDPDNLAGKLIVTHSILVNGNQRITLDSLKLIADNNNSIHTLSLQSNFINASIKGQYKLTQLADAFQQSINPYFSITQTKSVAKINPYNFTVNAAVSNIAALKAFLPTLKELKPITVHSVFASDSGWTASLQSPHIVYGETIIDNVFMNVETKDSALVYSTSFKQIKSGTAISMYATTLNGTLKNNNINFSLNIKDQKSADKYTLGGSLAIPSTGHYIFNLKPGNLLLNYAKWNIAEGNAIEYVDKDFQAHNFILSQGSRQLGIVSTQAGSNSPLQINFKKFNLAALSGIVESDSLLVNGLLDGSATVTNIQTNPTFTTDLTVSDLSIYQDTIGNFAVKINNKIANTYHADLALKGRQNDVSLIGDYNMKSDNSSYDFTLNIGALQIKSVEGFTKGGIKNAKGFLTGKIALNGTLKSPNIDGRLNFHNVAFNVSAVNNVYKIDEASIAVINNKGIELNNFVIKDTANNTLAIGGIVNTSDFLNYNFDLTVKARNFQAINSSSKDNKLFYGKMIFSTTLTIKGTPIHPVIDGTLTINDKTDFTVVLPQEDPEVAKLDGVVRFVNYSLTTEDSLLRVPYDSLNVAPLSGFDVSVNINVSKEASFNVIVDAANGDFLKLKGTGQLTAGIDASGKVTLAGSYEIDEGSYNLSFNFLKRNFIIQKGSRIVWTGEPTAAQISITAIYIANAAPLDLIQNQTSGTNQTLYKQKLPFEVHLTLASELLKPDISFDILLPSDKNYNVDNSIVSTVQNKLIEVRQDPGEMNKQVFALLLLNRFVGQDPFSSSTGSLDAGTLVTQSVSRLLTEQLNALTKNLIEGVDINFDVASTQDYTTGSQQNRTDLNVGISKRLLNDRLTVTVGSDFELQGPQPAGNQQQNFAGNVSINYKLSKDGKYMLRAYRKNDYTDIIEGYVIETGIGFIISVDFNKFSELFTTKEQRRKKREIKKENKADNKPETIKNDDVQTMTVPSKVN
jgi:hypothetical protein